MLERQKHGDHMNTYADHNNTIAVDAYIWSDM